MRAGDIPEADRNEIIALWYDPQWNVNSVAVHYRDWGISSQTVQHIWDQAKRDGILPKLRRDQFFKNNGDAPAVVQERPSADLVGSQGLLERLREFHPERDPRHVKQQDE